MSKVCVAWFGGLPLLLFASSCLPPPAGGFGPWRPDDKFSQALQRQENGVNGIEVGEPKIYDDSSLRLMLDQARGRLAAINSFNEAALTGRLGAISGSRIDQSQFGLQVGGPALPGVLTVANSPTTTTTTNAVPSQNTTLPATSVVTTAPTQNVTTTVAPTPAPPPPSVPAGLAFTPPTGLSGSALDVLSEEMQLNSEITGLQLLLEGALSDRFVKGQNIVKPRATIGFPISLTPQARYRNAVAVVEIEVTRGEPALADEPATITTLLPREKTYNVAAITDKNVSIGGGAVIGTVSAAASYGFGHKTYYVVQDQDTVAIQRPMEEAEPKSGEPPPKHDKTEFAWEFRPVLGREFVQGGMKQTFVQLAFPRLDSAMPKCFGSIRVRTYWRRFDQKTGLSGKVIPGSVLTRQPFPIPQYDLTPLVDDVVSEDLGDGTLLVNVRGRFLSGTYVQLGPTRYDVSSNLRAEESGLTFVATAEALARWTGQVVSRDGKKAAILKPSAQKNAPAPDQVSGGNVEPSPAQPPADCTVGSIAIHDVRVSPLDESRSEVRVELEPYPGFFDEILLDIGHKVFGLADTNPAIERDLSPAKPCITAVTPSLPCIRAVVPTSLLVASRSVRAFELFRTAPDGEEATLRRSRCFSKVNPLHDFDLDSAVERVVLLSQDQSGKAMFLVYGNGLKNATVLPPGTATPTALDNVPADRVLLLTIEKDKLQSIKKLVLQKIDGTRPLILDLPLPQPQPDAKPPKIALDSPVIQNTDEMVVPVERAAEVSAVKMGDQAVVFTPGTDTIRLQNLRRDGVTTEQKTRDLTFVFKDGTKVTVKLEVVAARVGVK